MIQSLGRRAAAIALISFAVLFFEITIIRILSVVLWYHWAFLSVSLAMLGLGAPGVWFHLRPPSPQLLGRLLTAAGVLLPLSIVAIFGAGDHFGAFAVLFCMICLLVPMLCLGAAVCLLLLQSPGPSIGSIYGADLLGASLAALLVIPAMSLVPTPHLAAALGLLPLAAAWLLDPLRRRSSLLLGLALLMLLAWGDPLRLRFSKDYDERIHTPIYEKWTPIARLTVFDSIFFRAAPGDAFGWGLGKQAPRITVPQYWLEQDGGAGTPLTRFTGDLETVSFLEFDVTTVGYQFARPGRVAIIGAGGGRDILSARLAGARHIDAVEMNREIVDIVSTRFKEFTGDVYHQPGVRPVVSEGRSFLTRTDARYDLIQISLIDSWAASAAGAFTLSENNLYTVEAYELYWSRLSENGILSTSRWMRGRKGLELPRLLYLHQAALRSAGVEDPNAHLAVVEGGAIGTVLLSRRPFTVESVRRLITICQERGFTLRHPPHGGVQDEGFSKMLAGGPDLLAGKGLDLFPPTDDRPFFFQVLPVFRFTGPTAAREYGINAESVFVLQLLVAVLIVVTLALFFLPFLLSGRALSQGGFWRGSTYFACIGLAFILIEIPWLQRFILYLGHPSYATTVVLGSILLGAGAGSLASARIGLARLRRWGPMVPVLAGAVNLSLSAIFQTTLGWGFPMRLLIASWLIIPIGFLMGLFFPLGMLRFGDDNKAWFWAMNGASSVLASVLSLALAMAFGYSAVAWAGVGFYVVAVGLLGGRQEAGA